VVIITMTCYSWAPSGGENLLTCGAIFWPPHRTQNRRQKVFTLVQGGLTFSK